jgi:HSP20 family molecular chaperone IbpA
MQTQKNSETATSQGSATGTKETTPLLPSTNILEHEHGVTLLVEMPGVSKERLQVHCDSRTLVVSGDVEIDMPADMDSLYADLRTTRYRREFSLSGEQLDTDAVSAALENGILKIDIPKREELRPRKIVVRAG